MTKLEQFQIERDEEEHKNNCLHCDIKQRYEYYVSMGISKRWAVRYAHWDYINRLYEKEAKGR